MTWRLSYILVFAFVITIQINRTTNYPQGLGDALSGGKPSSSDDDDDEDEDDSGGGGGLGDLGSALTAAPTTEADDDETTTRGLLDSNGQNLMLKNVLSKDDIIIEKLMPFLADDEYETGDFNISDSAATFELHQIYQNVFIRKLHNLNVDSVNLNLADKKANASFFADYLESDMDFKILGKVMGAPIDRRGKYAIQVYNYTCNISSHLTGPSSENSYTANDIFYTVTMDEMFCDLNELFPKNGTLTYRKIKGDAKIVRHPGEDAQLKHWSMSMEEAEPDFHFGDEIVDKYLVNNLGYYFMKNFASASVDFLWSDAWEEAVDPIFKNIFSDSEISEFQLSNILSSS